MKLHVCYNLSREINIDPADIADSLDLDASDDGIAQAVSATIDIVESERTWPSYEVRGKDELIKAVRQALNKAIIEDQKAP